MRGKALLECMAYIDDKLIEEALNPPCIPHEKNLDEKNNKYNTVTKWRMAAACVLVLGVSATAFWSHQQQKNTPHTENIEIADQMDKASKDTGDRPKMHHNDTGMPAESTATDTDLYTAGTEQDKEKSIEDAMEDKASAKQDSVYVEQYDEENGAADERQFAIEESQKTSYTILSDYYGEKDASVYDYPVPQKGTLLCYHDLQETINYYTKLENSAASVEDTIYAYQVVIDLYGDIETANGTQYKELHYINEGHTMIEQEYRRLIDLGYAVRLSEDFQLTGTFTKTEIDTFPLAPEYGYVFRFESET